MLQYLQFHGLGAVVTGAAAGIGRASAETLAGLGAHVFAVDVDGDGVAALAAALAAAGHPCTPIACDMTREADILAMAAQVNGAGIGIKTLVNNVGANYRHPTSELALEDWNRFLALNLTSAFLATRALLPRLLEAPRGGSVVNVSSTWAAMGGPDILSYTSSKAGMLGMTRQMAADYGDAGLRVNAVCPGLTLTDRIRGRGGVESNPMRARVLQGRFAEPQEIANVIAFLASDAASYMSGATVPVDGGQSIR